MSEGYSLEQQKLLIEALLTDRELFARCQNIINPTYFHKQYQKAVKFILNFAEEYKSMPSVPQLEADSGLQFALLDTISEEHQKYFLDEIEQFCRHQALTQAILKGSELIEKEDYNNIEKLVRDALLIGLHKDIGVDYFLDPKARLMRLKDSNGSMSTGWKTLDEKLYNVNRGELMIFAAPSGGGKSVALQNLAINMARQGYNCVYVTLELSAELCAKRMDSMVTGVALSDIFKRIDDVELSVVMAGKQSGRIFVKKMSNGCNTRDIRSYLKEYQIQTGIKPDVILIDYLDLMMPNDKRVSPSDLYVKDKYVSEELRALAEEFNMLCATASQFNRSAIDSIEFNHSHIGGGLSKIQTCDTAIGIFNNPRSRERGEIEFQLLKTRNSGGVDQKLMLAYDIDTLRISDLHTDSKSAHNKSQSSSVMDRIARKGRAEIASDSGAPNLAKAIEKGGKVDIADQHPIVKTEDPLQRSKNLSDLINKIKK